MDFLGIQNQFCPRPSPHRCCQGPLKLRNYFISLVWLVSDSKSGPKAQETFKEVQKTREEGRLQSRHREQGCPDPPCQCWGWGQGRWLSWTQWCVVSLKDWGAVKTLTNYRVKIGPEGIFRGGDQSRGPEAKRQEEHLPASWEPSAYPRRRESSQATTSPPLPQKTWQGQKQKRKETKSWLWGLGATGGLHAFLIALLSYIYIP